MAYQLPEFTELEREFADAELTFNPFHQARDLDGTWNRLVKRENPEEIPPALAVNQDGIDFQSPDPEKAILDHVAVCMLNPPVFDVQVPGEGKRYRDIERDHLLVKATWFNREINPKRRWERRVYEGPVRHGVKVEWLRPKPINPDREMQCPNYFQNTVLDGNYWLGDDADEGPDVHWYRYSVPLVDANIKRKDGSRYGFDHNGPCWLGADERQDYALIKGKKVDVYVRDGRDLSGKMCPLEGCYHAQRLITIYVCQQGDKFSEKAEEVETFPSPFPGSSFFIIGGHMLNTERDPHRIYRPMMYPMYVLQAYINMFMTWWLVLAVGESSDAGLYGDASQANPANLESLNRSEGGMKDSVEIPTPGVNEMPVLPFKVDRLPKATSQQLAGLIRVLLEKMSEYMPNRFQMGLNYTEASNATASANLSALQQSGIPYTPLLDEVSGAIDKWDRYTDHQIKYYALTEPDGMETRYYASVTDDENLAAYRSTIKKGEQVYLDASKCIPHDLIVKIENLTYAEKQAKWYLANSQYQSGVLTVEDLIKAAGIFDVIGQQERLFKGQIRQSLQPLMIRMYDLKLTREASIQTGDDFGQLLQQVEPQTPRVEQNGTPSTQAANTARQMNPTVNLPAMSTPSGGSGGGP